MILGVIVVVIVFQGGPCGVLAAVQAFVLKHLLFGGKKGDSKKYSVFLEKGYTHTLNLSDCIIIMFTPFLRVVGYL